MPQRMSAWGLRMEHASDPARTSPPSVQRYTTQRQIVARQKALRPQIREAKQRGDDAHAQALLAELRALRVRLRHVRHQQRASHPPPGS
jgi:hypothetical protein